MNRPYIYEEGYRSLAAEIIMQAIFDLDMSREIVDKIKGRAVKYDAIRFFKSELFYSLAYFLDLEPEKAQKKILEKYLW